MFTYAYHHKTEEGKQNTLKFLELERELDEENSTTIEYMNRDHLNKRQSKQVDAATKRWIRENKSLSKKILSIRVNSTCGVDRTWL